MDENESRDNVELAILSSGYILTEKQIENFRSNAKNLPKLTKEDIRICYERLSNNRKDVQIHD